MIVPARYAGILSRHVVDCSLSKACLLVCCQSAKLSTCSSPVQLSQAKDIISLQKPSSSSASAQHWTQRYGKINWVLVGPSDWVSDWVSLLNDSQGLKLQGSLSSGCISKCNDLMSPHPRTHQSSGHRTNMDIPRSWSAAAALLSWYWQYLHVLVWWWMLTSSNI